MYFYAFKSFSHCVYATPVPKPVPKTSGQRLRLMNSKENTAPTAKPPAVNVKKHFIINYIINICN